MTNDKCILYPEAIKRLTIDLEMACNNWDYLSSIGGRGPIEAFEKIFSKVVQGKKAIALNNATSALFVALLACGVKTGDEVILPAYTWPQTLTPVIMAGAIPVFADIGSDTVTISPESVSQLISEKTKAIIGVHLYGVPADVVALQKIAKKSHCALIFDAAQGFGATFSGKFLGAYGDFIACSLGRGKLLSAGEGGALICRAQHLYEKAVSLSQHPLRMHRDLDNPRMRERIDGVCMNFRMHPLIASLAIGQIEGLLAENICANLRLRVQEIYRELRYKEMDSFLPKVNEKAVPCSALLPLLCPKTSQTLIDLDFIKSGKMEIIEEPSILPLYLTPSIRRHKIQGGVQKIPKHPSHKIGSCPNTEERCRGNQVFLKLI